jgi:hypothetical protein
MAAPFDQRYDALFIVLERLNAAEISVTWLIKALQFIGT